MYNKHYQTFPKSFTGLMEDLLQGGKVFADGIRQEDKRGVPVNIEETADAYRLDVFAPGLSKDAVQVKVDKNVLTISYEHTEQAADTKVLRSEFRQHSFSRSFTLNEKVNPDAISARYQDGVLQIGLPKKEQAAPSSRNISVD